MVDGRQALRTRIGRYGIWIRGMDFDPESGFHRDADRLGFGSLWLGSNRGAELAMPERILDETEGITVATGIVNIWTADPHELADAYHRIAAKHGDRFVLGIGSGHIENDDPRAAKPYTWLVEYLDVLESRGVPRDALALAALGDRVVALAGARTAGPHPYLVTPGHTRHARELLGPSPLLFPEQRVVLEPDRATALDIARDGVAFYFGLSNYRRNLRAMGFSDEELDTESDRAIGIVVSGDAQAVKAGLDAHLEAGADTVLAQLVLRQGDDRNEALAALARALELTPRR